MIPYYQIFLNYTFKNIDKRHMRLIHTNNNVCLNCMLAEHPLETPLPSADEIKNACPMSKYMTTYFTEQEVYTLQELNNGKILNDWINSHQKTTEQVLEIITLRTYDAIKKSNYVPDFMSIKTVGLKASPDNYTMRFIILANFTNAHFITGYTDLELVKSKIIEKTRGEIFNLRDVVSILDKGESWEILQNKKNSKIIFA